MAKFIILRKWLNEATPTKAKAPVLLGSCSSSCENSRLEQRFALRRPAKRSSLAFATKQLCLFIGLVFLTPSYAQVGRQTALDRYVTASDPEYGYQLIQTIPAHGYTTYVLEMTSQSWLSSREVDRPVWKHWMTI